MTGLRKQGMRGKMKITKRQLRRLIREAVDIMNSETGELLIFDDVAQGADAPEPAAAEILRRLKITPLSKEVDPGDDPVADEIENWTVTPEDFAVIDTEIHGKRRYRHAKKEDARLNTSNLFARLDQWIEDAKGDWESGNMGQGDGWDPSMQDVARDLAMSAEYEFRPDEWEELLWHYDKELSYGDPDGHQTAEDVLMDYIANGLAG